MTDNDDTRRDAPDEPTAPATSPEEAAEGEPEVAVETAAEVIEGPTPEIAQPEEAAPSSAEAFSKFKDRLEMAASRVIHEKMGAPLGEDGKVDFAAIDKEALEPHSKDIALGILNAFADEIAAIRKRPDSEDVFDLGPEPPTPGEFASRLRTAFDDWADQLKKSFSQKLHDSLGLPLDEDGILDVERIESPEGRDEASARIVSIMEEFGAKLETRRKELETKGEMLGQRIEEAEQAAVTGGEEEPDEELDEDVLEDTDQEAMADLIDFDEWRERFEKQREGFKLGDSISETLNNFIEGHLIPQLSKGGNVNLNIDQNFLKEHGPALLQQVIQGVAERIQTPKIELTLPLTEKERREREERAAKWREETAETPEAESSPAGETAQVGEGEEDAAPSTPSEGADEEPGEVKVSLNFDLRRLFRRIFKPATPPADDGGDSGSQD
jgi:hypothetical protein